MVHETKIRVRYGETDQMGIVYHPNYYIYFEIGRSEYLREMSGMSYKDMEDAGVMMPIIETHCKYLSPAKYDDELIVLTSIKALTVARMIFLYKVIRKKDRTVLAEGETSQAFVNKEGKPINLKKYNKEFYDKLHCFLV